MTESAPKELKPYFNADYLPSSQNEFVAWIDIMGTKSHFKNSLKSASNFIFKLHGQALNIAPKKNITLYPVMDGLYATTKDEVSICSFLIEIFTDITRLFIDEPHDHFKFIIRGGISYGEIIHGRDITDPNASYTLNSNPQYRDKILIGVPIGEAHYIEQIAPPFGISIHESVRKISSELSNEWFVWWKQAQNISNHDVLESLDKYYQKFRSQTFSYDPNRMIIHQSLAKCFFG